MGIRYKPSVRCAVLLILAMVAPAGAGKIYWADVLCNSIRRANLDGTNLEDLVSWEQQLSPRGLALDFTTGRMYWSAGWTSPRGSMIIRSATLDGADERVLLSRSEYIAGIAVDSKSQTIFWSNGYVIFRANTDGSGVRPVVQVGSEDDIRTLVVGVALDTVNQMIYWNGWASGVGRASFDGSNREMIVDRPGSYTEALGIAVDPIGRKVYWVESLAGGGFSANLDGSDVEQVGDLYWYNRGIAVDGLTGVAYWSEGNHHVTPIVRTTIATGEQECFMPGGAFGMALDLRERHDGDGDRRIDLLDFRILQTCFSPAARAPVSAWCEVFDDEPDHDIDLFDFAAFQEARTVGAVSLPSLVQGENNRMQLPNGAQVAIASPSRLDGVPDGPAENAPPSSLGWCHFEWDPCDLSSTTSP